MLNCLRYMLCLFYYCYVQYYDSLGSDNKFIKKSIKTVSAFFLYHLLGRYAGPLKGSDYYKKKSVTNYQSISALQKHVFVTVLPICGMHLNNLLVSVGKARIYSCQGFWSSVFSQKAFSLSLGK